MWYLIHTDAHPRPYLTSVPFIAHDFHTWNHRVHPHPMNSAYIREIRDREKLQKEREWRVELPEIWAREVLRRKGQQVSRVSGPESQEVRRAVEEEEEAHLTNEEKRLHRTSRLAHDFLQGIAAFGECGCRVHEFLRAVDRGTHAAFPIDQHPVPPGSISVISKYMRLVRSTRYGADVALPEWADPAIAHADKVTIEFNPHPAVKSVHLVHAMEKAVSQGKGRMGMVKKYDKTGVFMVLLFVDVGDCVAARPWTEGDEYSLDPVPVYERGEGPPAYV